MLIEPGDSGSFSLSLSVSYLRTVAYLISDRRRRAEERDEVDLERPAMPLLGGLADRPLLVDPPQRRVLLKRDSGTVGAIVVVGRYAASSGMVSSSNTARISTLPPSAST